MYFRLFLRCSRPIITGSSSSSGRKSELHPGDGDGGRPGVSLSTPLVVKVEEESSPFSFLSFSLSLSQNKPKTGNHGSPYVRSAYACSYSCNGYQGGAGSEGLTANAFTYCDDPKGCGENCADFTRGKAPIDGSKDRLFFGPFATAPKSVCTPENKFPYQMCSCKRVDGEGGGDESKEWVSGFTVERPAGK